MYDVIEMTFIVVSKFLTGLKNPESHKKMINSTRE